MTNFIPRTKWKLIEMLKNYYPQDGRKFNRMSRLQLMAIWLRKIGKNRCIQQR